jgi:hypothetical protein
MESDLRASLLFEATRSISAAGFESFNDVSGLLGKDISRTDAKLQRNTWANHSERQLRARSPDDSSASSSPAK